MSLRHGPFFPNVEKLLMRSGGIQSYNFQSKGLKANDELSSLLSKLPAALSNGREANTSNFKGAVLLQHRTIQQFHINFSLMAFLKSCKLTQINSFQSRVKVFLNILT